MEQKLIKQSDSVTFSKYKMSGFQINALINVISELQKFIDMDVDWSMADSNLYLKHFGLDDHFNFKIPLAVSDIDVNYHSSRVFNQLREIVKITVTYEYIDDNNVKHKRCFAPFNIVDIDENNIVTLHLGIFTLRWILQYGQKTKLTTFDKRSVLSLKGVYAKRVFQILSSHYKERIFSMRIDELSDILCAPKYSVQDFERYVLRTAQMEMVDNDHSRLFFKYKLVTTERRKSSGRPKRDTVIFKVYDRLNEGSFNEFLTDKFENG